MGSSGRRSRTGTGSSAVGESASVGWDSEEAGFPAGQGAVGLARRTGAILLSPNPQGKQNRSRNFQKGANRLFTRPSSWVVGTARRAVRGRLGEATLPKPKILSPHHAVCPSTAGAKKPAVSATSRTAGLLPPLFSGIARTRVFARTPSRPFLRPAPYFLPGFALEASL